MQNGLMVQQDLMAQELTDEELELVAGAGHHHGHSSHHGHSRHHHGHPSSHHGHHGGGHHSSPVSYTAPQTLIVNITNNYYFVNSNNNSVVTATAVASPTITSASVG